MINESSDQIYFDSVTESMGYGHTYGEFSLNGQPLYPGSIGDLWGSNLLEDLEPWLMQGINFSEPFIGAGTDKQG